MRHGPPPKPLALRIIEGNPGRQRLPRETVIDMPSTIPDPPPILNKIAREEWFRVAEGLHALGLLQQVDRNCLGAYCQSYAMWVQALRGLAEIAKTDDVNGGLTIETTNGNVIQNPMVGIANKAAADMLRYAGEFGMTPAARTRMAIEAMGPKASKFSGLTDGRQAS